MKTNKLFIIVISVLLSTNLCFSQNSVVWLTYGQSKFLYSPGIEGNYIFNKHFGVQLGVNVYFQNYDKNKIVNNSDDNLFNFYNANLGACYLLMHKETHKIGITSGLKVYYGPEYTPLHYYTNGGYNIYFDSSGLRPDFGVDIGVFYVYRKVSGILKFDTARKKLRFGLGYKIGW